MNDPWNTDTTDRVLEIQKTNCFLRNMKTTSQNNLAAWLGSPGMTDYLGPSAMFKLEVLAHLMGEPGTLAAIGRRYGKSRNAAHFHATSARRLFGLDKVKG